MQCDAQVTGSTDRPLDWSTAMQMIQNFPLSRSDTLFGVCQALGEDLGISPLWFRVAVASAVVLNFEVAIALYLGLAVIALASRFIYRSAPKAAAATKQKTTEAVVVAEEPVVAAPRARDVVLAEAA
jgi:phage shock protein C